jgi:hypothetical protein
MPLNEQIEQQIRDVLAAETHAIRLSNRLFSPEGLFNRLAPTEEERRGVARSPLFKQAQRRFLELQRKEAADYSQALREARVAISGDHFFIKLENTESI